MQPGSFDFSTYSPAPAALICLLLVVLITVQAVSAEPSSLPTVDELPTDPLAWLDLIAPLINQSELSVYRALEHDYQRQAFIDRFWRERDPFPETGRNEFLETWQLRLQLVHERFGNLQEDRAETLLLTGPPQQILTGPCPRALEHLEIWLFTASHQLAEPIALVFVEDMGAETDRLIRWSPSNGLSSLSSRSADIDPGEAIRPTRPGPSV